MIIMGKYVLKNSSFVAYSFSFEVLDGIDQ